jgi:type I restriction enzyme R subunit
MTAPPLKSPNFNFLADHDPQLLEYAARAERYVLDDPNTTLIKLRQLAEALAEDAAAYDGMRLLPEDDFSDILRRLKREDIITQEMADIFHGLRKAGNEAAHEGGGTRQDAVSQLKLAHRLAVWFHRAFRDPAFKPRPFLLPPAPDGVAPEVKEELERLRKARWDAEREADETEGALEVAERKREAAEAKAAQLYADLEAALALVHDNDPRQEHIARQHEVTVEQLRADAHAASHEERAARQHQARSAARAFDLSEEEARDQIDAQLRASGWEADAVVFTWAHSARPEADRNMAIAAVPTSAGPADYILYCGLRAAAVIEAKRSNTDLRAALDEAARYGKAYQALADETIASSSDATHPIPLLFASNGRPFTSESDPRSGVWMRDVRTGKTQAVKDWPTPEELEKLL